MEGGQASLRAPLERGHRFTGCQLFWACFWTLSSWVAMSEDQRLVTPPTFLSPAERRPGEKHAPPRK
jgi:hypothetical protein